MNKPFEHLLGLSTQTALALLHAVGIMDVRVIPSAAPPRKQPTASDALRTDGGEAEGYASTRVVAVRDDGKTLLVSRFLVDSPSLRTAQGEFLANAAPASALSSLSPASIHPERNAE